jgi:hypothetical protein
VPEAVGGRRGKRDAEAAADGRFRRIWSKREILVPSGRRGSLVEAAAGGQIRRISSVSEIFP